jgi:hypothetical protein
MLFFFFSRFESRKLKKKGGKIYDEMLITRELGVE